MSEPTNLRGRKTPLNKAAIEARRAEAVALRSAGQTWEAIAIALGYSGKGAAHNDVTKALQERAEKTGLSLDHYRAQEIEHLSELRRKAMDVMNAQHLLVQGGGVVYMAELTDDGKVRLDPETMQPVTTAIALRDSGPTLAAIDRLVRIAERMSRMVGGDQAVKVEVEAKQYHYTINGVDQGALQ